MCEQCGVKRRDADSPQVRLTYLIIGYVDCPVCSSVAGQLCNPEGMSPSVFHTHKARLAQGEVLHEVQRFRAVEAQRAKRYAS